MASIRKHGEGWQARVRRKGFPESTRTFRSKSDAERWARSAEGEMERGVFIDRTQAENCTLSDVLERYLQEVNPLLRGHSEGRYTLKAMQRARIAQFSMAALTPQVVAEWRNELLERVAPGTVVRHLATLSAVINHARREWGMHISNPVQMVRKPSQPPGRSRVLTYDEEKRLLVAAAPVGRRSPWLLPAIVISIETAMRRGELLALRWPDVDLARQVAYLRMTKNGDSRFVPLSSRAVEALTNLKQLQQTSQLLLSSRDDRVIPMSAAAISKRFEAARETAELADFRWHDLRHTAATRIAPKLSNLIELSCVTGHKSIAMLKRYVHPEAETLAKKLG
ncbi:tyrosine-type recombinase/integrase [Noviherbaspirillum soli]|uniref:tyrosine-type recombinase/integrase n=1 Tax=Noviherbaspirillum soli TaxID=1064518 RepID=UPI00188DAF5A|nr:site-specific integrase [Noviherbaspirillum soli]